MDYKLLDKDSYEEKLSDLLKRREDSGNEGQHIYADPKGIPTVGIGYALLYANHHPRDIDQIKADMKIALPSEKYADIRWDKVEKLLSNIHKHLDAGYSSSMIHHEIDNYYKVEGNHALRLSTQEEKTLLVNATLPQFEASLDRKLDKALPLSEERIAVMSQLYRLGISGAPSMIKAINEGNRAEAWYEIRYNSNADNLTGNYGRVIEESDLFGLHDRHPNAKNENDIKHMFTKHATKIKEEERKSPLYKESKEENHISLLHSGILPLEIATPNKNIEAFLETQSTQEPLDSTTYAQNLIDNLYPHLAPTQTNSENTRELNPENQYSAYDNNLPESVNEYLSQFASQGYENDMEMDIG